MIHDDLSTAVVAAGTTAFLFARAFRIRILALARRVSVIDWIVHHICVAVPTLTRAMPRVSTRRRSSRRVSGRSRPNRRMPNDLATRFSPFRREARARVTHLEKSRGVDLPWFSRWSSGEGADGTSHSVQPTQFLRGRRTLRPKALSGSNGFTRSLVVSAMTWPLSLVW